MRVKPKTKLETDAGKKIKESILKTHQREFEWCSRCGHHGDKARLIRVRQRIGRVGELPTLPRANQCQLSRFHRIIVTLIEL